MDENAEGMTFRIGGPGDFPAVLEIQRRAYALKEAPLYGDAIPPLAETPEMLAAEIAEGKALLIGEMAGRVVASLRMKRRDDGAVYFCRLSVDPDMQGRGIGQKMALAVEALHPEAPAFHLDCGVDSAENMHIYTKLGYRETGGRVQVPNGPLCLEMRKSRS